MSQNLNVIVPILNKRTDQRTFQDLEQLIPILKKIDFFKEKEIKENDLQEIAVSLKYEFHRAQNIVFDHGQSGDKFYIILHGTVAVQIPIKKKKVNQDDEQSNQPIQTSDLGRANNNDNVIDVTQLISSNDRTRGSSMQKNKIVHSKLSMDQPPVGLNYRKIINKRKSKDYISSSKLLVSGEAQVPLSGRQSFLVVNNEQPNQQDPNTMSKTSIQAIKKDQTQDSVMNPDSQAELLIPEDSVDNHQRVSIKQPSHFDRRREKQQSNADEDEQEEEIIFTQVAEIATGKSFGELALITNKPRAARIKCLTDCHFAVMTKNEYNKCLAKIENKNRIRTIQFLSDLPFFASLSKTQLGKLLTSFNVQKYKRGNVLFKEGSSNEDIFIVRNGEFQGIRTMVIKNKNIQDPVMQYLRGERTNKSLRTTFNSQICALTNVKQITSTNSTKEQIQVILQFLLDFQLFLFGKGQIFGEERFLRNQQIAPYTAVCSSLEAEVMRISSIEFMRKILVIPETVEIIKQNTNYKENKITHKQYEGLLKHNHSVDRPSSKQQQAELQNQKFSKYLLKQSNEKRETLKQIVEGYPVVQKVQKLIKEEDQSTLLMNNSVYTTSKYDSVFRITNPKNSMIISDATTLRNSAITSPFSDDKKLSLSPFKRIKRFKNEKPKGSKLYMSSQLVSAIIEMKRHTQDLEVRRTDNKEMIEEREKRQVIDEIVLSNHNISFENSDDDISEHSQDMHSFRTAGITGVKPIETVNDINVSLNNNLIKKFFQGGSMTTGINTPSNRRGSMFNQSNIDGDDIISRANYGLHKQNSKKSFKSLVVNSNNNKRQSINLHQKDIVALPNKSFYNGDGSQIKMLRANHQEFSPLIQYLVKQRNFEYKRPEQNRSLIKPGERQNKVMDKTVFMHVAETLRRGNVTGIKNHSLSTRSKQIFPFIK